MRVPSRRSPSRRRNATSAANASIGTTDPFPSVSLPIKSSCHGPQKRAIQMIVKLNRRADARRLGGPVKCSHLGHSRHLFGDMTDTFGAGQVDGSDPMACEEDAVFSVGASGTDGDAFSAESLGHFPELSLEVDVVLGGGHAAHDLVLAVLGLRQFLGHS